MDEDRLAKLERLAALFKEGMLTKAEFDEQKRDILDGNAQIAVGASDAKADVEPTSDIKCDINTANPTDSFATVLSALGEKYLTPVFGSSSAYYSQKFHHIVSKADIGDLDISGNLNSITTKVQRTTSFNLWGFLFGPLWGCYRRLHSAWAFIVLIAIYSAGEIILDFSYPSVDRGIAIGGVVLFGILGNSLLLSRYLNQYSKESDVEDIRRKLVPALWAPAAAFALMITPALIEFFIITGNTTGVDFYTENESTENQEPERELLNDGKDISSVDENSDEVGLTTKPDALSIDEGRCHMGSCTWSAIKSIEEVGNSDTGRLLRLSIIDGESSHPDDGYPSKFSDGLNISWSDAPYTTYVFCSTKIPAIISNYDSAWRADIFDFEAVYGAQTSSANLYVRACHKLPSGAWGQDDFVSENGYSSMTSTEQLVLANPEEILSR
jgi:hypothetical protein